MMPYFIWKGKNSFVDFGLWIGKLPKRMRGEERHTEIEVPGRAGTLVILEGEDVYSSFTAELVVIAKNDLNLDEIMSWLRGSGELSLFNDQYKVRDARIIGEVAFERIGNSLQQATIPFYCQPFRKNRLPGNDTKTFSSSGTIYNPGDVASKPIVKIVGSGSNTISIGGKTMVFDSLSGTNANPVIVDCGAEIVTKAGAVWEESVTGEFWRIPVGSSSITQTGSMTIKIEPEWRWL